VCLIENVLLLLLRKRNAALRALAGRRWTSTIFYSVMAAAGVVGALAASMGSSALASSVLSYFVMRIVMVRISPRLIFQEALAEPAAAQGAAINVSLVHNGELVRASVLWVLGVVGASVDRTRLVQFPTVVRASAGAWAFSVISTIGAPLPASTRPEPCDRL
jgi:hypothetical protein